MSGIKSTIKKILPVGLFKPFLPLFHTLQAWWWNAASGWPARNLKVIGITGTNGKTTTAAFLGKILEAGGHTIGISTTAFYQIGSDYRLNDTNMTVTDPKRLFALLKTMKQAGVDWVILEVTSHSLEQNRVAGIPFAAAIMTNLTQDHLDYHGHMDAYAAAKGKLFARKARFHILNRDDEWFHFFDKYQPLERTLTYGTDPDADCKITAARLGVSGSNLKFELERTKLETVIGLAGKFNAYNALCAAATAHALGISAEHIKAGLEALEAVPGRMEAITDKKRGIKVIIDYAHTPDALQNVLETLRGVSSKRIITVTGATGDRDKSKRPLMGKTVASLSDVAIITDDDPYTEDPAAIRAEVLQGAHSSVDGAEILEVGERKDAIKKAIELAKKGDVILLAGIGHQSYRVINGQKVEWNEREITEKLLGQKNSPKPPRPRRSKSK